MPARRRHRTTSRAALLCWAPLGIAVLATLVLWIGVDRWWPLLPLGYGPRWPWLALPFVPLISGQPWTRRVVAALATLAVVAHALIGWRYHFPDEDTSGGATVRIATFNAATRTAAVARFLPFASARQADLVVIVECPRQAAERTLEGYRQVAAGEVCAWSRLGDGPPRLVSAPRDPRVIGWSGAIARLDLAGSDIGPIGVVHLRSVRNELEEFLDLSELLGQADSMEARRSKRIAGSRHASAWFRTMDPAPALVVGDFNLVVESSRFRADWAGWRDSFEEVGRGAGYTWHSRWYGLRIDHVLHDATWRTVGHEVGPDLGSDHRPLIVTLARR